MSQRKFDWDEAARLYEELRNYEAVGRRLGVTGPAVRYAIDAEHRRRALEHQHQPENRARQRDRGRERYATEAEFREKAKERANARDSEAHNEARRRRRSDPEYLARENAKRAQTRKSRAKVAE